ncbi:MAG: hypothetical protein LBQ32_07455 [Burkholderiaceae bacterium]|jgi:hypothetical protein|nr:hypothetical protein [Burkholderiaceae bacterium]
MNPDIDPFVPPQPVPLWVRARSVLLRKTVATPVALVILVAVVAYLTYARLAANAGPGRAAVESPQAAASAAADDEPKSAVSPAPPTEADAEPPAPAVAGGSVNKCLINDQLTYTNSPCPEGSRPVNDDVAATAARPALSDSANRISQQTADCSFLSAEIARLDYEFNQLLPPEVLDHISTRLAILRAQAEAARCVPPPSKPAADAISAPERSRAPAKALNPHER